MDINGKYRPFYIAKLLEELTDEDHYLTTAQIMHLLEERYGMTTHRQTIPPDIEILRTVGMDIDCIPSTQNRYRLMSRRFNDDELRLLIDAVDKSQNIKTEKKEELIEKLAKEAGVCKEASMKAGVKQNRRARTRGTAQYTKKHLLELWEAMDNQGKAQLIESAETKLQALNQ